MKGRKGAYVRDALVLVNNPCGLVQGVAEEIHGKRKGLIRLQVSKQRVEKLSICGLKSMIHGCIVYFGSQIARALDRV